MNARVQHLRDELAHKRPTFWLRLACVMTLCALGLMVWSLLDPTWLPIIVAMSGAQVFGTLAFAMYLFVVARELLRHRAVRRGTEQGPRASGLGPRPEEHERARGGGV